MLKSRLDGKGLNHEVDDDAITGDAILAAKGDRAAAERFVSATQASLYRVLRHLSNPGVAEDLVQETYLRAFAALPGFARHCPARLWLLAIARRVAADHLRAARRRPSVVTLEEQLAAVDRPGDNHVADHARLVAVRHLIAALDQPRREAFVFTQVLGLSYEDVARICDCPVGTVRSRVYRAREELIDALHAPSAPRRIASS